MNDELSKQVAEMLKQIERVKPVNFRIVLRCGSPPVKHRYKLEPGIGLVCERCGHNPPWMEAQP